MELKNKNWKKIRDYSSTCYMFRNTKRNLDIFVNLDDISGHTIQLWNNTTGDLLSAETFTKLQGAIDYTSGLMKGLDIEN